MKKNRVGIFAPLNMNRLAGDTARILELVRGLRGHNVTAIPIIPKGGKPEISSSFTPCIKYKIPVLSNSALNYPTLVFFSQYLLSQEVYYNNSFNIIQIEWSYALPFSKMRKIAKEKNVVFDMHSIASIDLAHYFPKLFRKPVSVILQEAQDYLCSNSRCIVVSDSMKRFILQKLSVDSNMIHVIPNGVNVRVAEESISKNKSKFSIISKDTNLVLVYVGGLEWYEGVDVLIASLSLIKKQIPKFKLIIAGKGSQESMLRRLVTELNLDEYVIFLGWISYEDTFALQATADILIAPRKPLSKDGIDISTPMKLPSYLTAGVPIITSYIGNIPNVVRDGKEGLLIRHLDADNLSSAILDLWANPEKMNRFGINCKRRANEFSWEKISTSLIEVYDLTLNDMQ